MTPVSIIFWTELHAILAEIEGMKAANQSCQHLGTKPTYADVDFFLKASELRSLVERQHNIAPFIHQSDLPPDCRPANNQKSVPVSSTGIMKQ